ncbi:uncharacterized protein LOC116032031 isoform X1 [Ipomoea triloba]|uniref:uncharacterized protein LOC116032031 isoform X1 n=1 Tax=Ipomoea triloba TaxID=35885 RepID=UPI00125E0FAF|nr:uncharacterized protein LOC116032031 isoform X1 [Ipomoea triloba]
MAASLRSFIFLFFLILIKPTPSSSSIPLPLSNHQILLSLSHSLLARVANHRAARGDAVGAARARSIARVMDRGLGMGLWEFTWSLGRDYARKFSLRDTMSFEMVGAVSDLNELVGALGELTQVRSESERVAWVNRNSGNVIRIAKSLSGRLLKTIRQSGPLREVMETVQKEIVEGDLLKDCLELGGNDFKGLIQVLKDIALQYSTSTRTDL